jgi:Leucine-rich repeat (LRR) protein
VQLHTPLPSVVKREAVSFDPLAVLSSTTEAETDLSEETSKYAPHPTVETFQSRSSGIFSSVENLTRNFLQECTSSPTDPASVPRNLNGMKKLAQHNIWRTVLDISGSLSTDLLRRAFEALDTESIFTLSLRYESLFRLKMFDELSSELGKALSQISHLQDESGSDSILSAQRDCIRIALTILFAETQFMIGHGNEALAQLYVLRLTQERAGAQSTEGRKWIMKLGLSVVNMLLRQHQWTNAISELKELLSAFKKSELEYSSAHRCCYEVLMLCKLARVMLHVGAAADGEHYIEIAQQIMQCSLTTGDLALVVEDYVVVSKGLVLQSKNQVRFFRR